MKKLRIAVLLVTVISLIGLILACDNGGGGSGSTTTNKTPSSNHYEIVGVRAVDFGTPLTISVRVRAGVDASSATPSDPIFVNGDADTPTYNSATPPTAIGLYDVLINVPAASGWNAADGLSLGSVSIRNPNKENLTLAHFDLSDFPNGLAVQEVTSSNRPAVRVAVGGVPGLANTDITTLYNNGAFPTTAGYYDVTFNVRTTDRYNPVSGLSAGILRLTDPGEQTNVVFITAEDFNVVINDVSQNATAAKPGGFDVQFENKPLFVKLTGGKSYPAINDPEKVVIQYWWPRDPEDLDGEWYMNNEPKDAGDYEVRVKVAPIVERGATWNGPEFTFKLKISPRDPIYKDFVISKLVQSEKGMTLDTPIEVSDVDIDFIDQFTDPDSIQNLEIEIYYDSIKSEIVDGVTTIPQTPGDYSITFHIVKTGAGNKNWNETTTPIQGGTLKVIGLVPVRPNPGTKLWIDEDTDILMTNVPATSDGKYELATRPGPQYAVPFTFDNKKGYTVIGWFEDGTPAPAGSISGYTYTFSKWAIGWHTVTLVVKAPDVTVGGVTTIGKTYSETVRIMVQTTNQ